MPDDAIRGVAETRLRQFWADALRKAGGSDSLAAGAEKLAVRLTELGYLGKKGMPYNPGSLEHWAAGRTDPGADVMFAVAIDLDMSLDEYVHGRKIEQEPDAVVKRLDDLETNQNLLLAWLSTDEEMTRRLRTHAPALLDRLAG